MSEEIVNLRKPITIHGKTGAETVSQLTLRETPGLTKLALERGLPFATLIEQTANDSTRVEFRMNPALARVYLVEMSGLDAVALEQLSIQDLRTALDALTRILNPTDA